VRSLVAPSSENPSPHSGDREGATRLAARLDFLRTASRIPGLAIVILRDTTVILARGFGYADLERAVPVTPETPFNIASVTKPISAVVALRLVERGLLDLDRPLTTYEGFEDFCADVRGEGGIFFRDYECDRYPMTLRHMLSMTANGVTGTRFFYNPPSYSWARPMAQISGTAFSELTANEVFEPAGMTHSARETGEVTLGENLRLICDHLGHIANSAQIQSAVAVRRQFTRASPVPRDDALQALSDLRAMGFSIGLISDCCDVVSQLWETTSLAPHLDAAILSFRVGMRKPERRIYTLASEALSVESSRCLYVGDGGSHELTGAVRAGMEAILLLVEAEIDLDPYRPDARTWTGPAIGSLTELVHILRAGRRPTSRCT